jgi:hypothetical protein|mmetsp:Transcript_26534/g.31083  ORF Transcript_26534/g.31083 Transcript_26534/m.31083 type:complete len:470 (+) Transcript_26534:16-1425(+)
MDEPHFSHELDFEEEEHDSDFDHEEGQRDHHQGRGRRHRINKMMMKERRMEHMHSRAAFVTFLMWLCVFVAGAIGFRASKTQDNNRWIRCTLKKSVFFVILASLLGVWKLRLDFKLMRGMDRMHREMRNKPRNNMFGEHKQQWKFQDYKQMSPAELKEAKLQWITEKQEQFFGNGRNLQASAERQGRRLSSAFDVFDFVSNAISSGVKQAKHTTGDALKKIDEHTSKVLRDAKKIGKDIENYAKMSVEEVKLALEKHDDAADHVLEHLAEVAEAKNAEAAAAPAEAAVEEVDKTPEHPELQASVIPEAVIEAAEAQPNTDPIIAEPVDPVVETIVETPKEEAPVEEVAIEITPVEEAPVEEAPVEVVPELDAFTIEEMATMQTLAEMGRLFDDVDEARMVKLTEDLTAWINKYAPTFEDPEELLFEVTTPLITPEMEASLTAAEQPAKTAIEAPVETPKKQQQMQQEVV